MKVFTLIEASEEGISLRTQKAKGIQALALLHKSVTNRASENVNGAFIGQEIRLAQIIIPEGEVKLEECNDLHYTKDAGFNLMFIRPCPVVPQHGFVESRKFETGRDLHDAINETLDADPEGEILLMNYVDAEYSAVLTSKVLTIGRGNDGVTDDKGELIDISFDESDFRHQWPLNRINTDRHLFGISEDEDMALELLWSGRYKSWMVVQVRAVSKNVSAAIHSYIPRDMLVTRILPVFMEPKTLAVRLKLGVVSGNPGILYTVRSLRSHVATQLIEAGFAVATKGKIRVGQELKNNLDTLPERNQKDLEQFARNLRWLFSKKMSDIYAIRGTVESLSLGANCASYMAKRSHYVNLVNGGDRQLLAFGMYCMVYCSTVACIGEARHQYARTRDGLKYHGLIHKVFAEYIESSGVIYLNRDDMYYGILPKSRLPRILTLLSTAFTVHYNMKWKRGYGGPKWAEIAQVNMDLYEGIRKFTYEPYEETYNNLLSKYNVASYTTHNGGIGALSKFGHVGDFSVISKLGINFLDRPLGEKEGKLPAIRIIRIPPKLSRIRRYPLMPVGRYDDAMISIQISLISKDKSSAYYMILFPGVNWKQRNVPMGFVMSGMLDTEQMKRNPKFEGVFTQSLGIYGSIALKGYYKGVSISQNGFTIHSSRNLNHINLGNIVDLPIKVIRGMSFEKARAGGKMDKESLYASYRHFPILIDPLLAYINNP